LRKVKHYVFVEQTDISSHVTAYRAIPNITIGETLTVFVFKTMNKSILLQIFIGNDWLLGVATLISSDSFQVVLEGIRGNDFHGDIAIDDVRITDGNCVQPESFVSSTNDFEPFSCSHTLQCASTTRERLNIPYDGF